MRRSAVLSACLLLLSCATDVGATGLAINDPLDLIDDVEGPLRLFVLPAEAYECDATTGAVSPEVPDVQQGTLEEAVADVELTVMGSSARSELSVPPGEYTVLVRGKGTDRVTGIRDTFIATGCTGVAIGSGETVEIRVTLIPIVGQGECGDGTLSPDEQCEDGNTTDGDGCSATCKTEPFPISTTTGKHDSPSLAGAPGQRWVTTFDNLDGPEVRIRMLEPNGSTITFPGALTNDASLSPGIAFYADVAVASDGRIGASYLAGGTEVRIAFFDANRTAQGSPMTLRNNAGSNARSSVAFAGDDTFLVVFQDPMSATGLSGAVVAAGATTTGSLFEVGASGASAPAVAGASDHFVVAFSAGGDVFVQRFGTDGAPRDASPIPVLEDAAGTQDQPAVGALPDGRALVVWRDSEGDGAGTAIRARAFGADGRAAGPAITLNTTTAGDQSAPAAAGGGDTFAVAFQHGSSSVRARLLSSQGDPIPNREQPPTTADFEVAAGGKQPSVAAGGPSGTRWMVAWTEADAIHGRSFQLD